MHSRRLLCVAVAVCVASLGDVVTTWYGLEHAGLYEANPGAKHVLDAHGYGGMLLGKSVPAFAAIALSGLSVRLWSDGSEWEWYAPAIALVAVNVGVTAHNGMLILSA